MDFALSDEQVALAEAERAWLVKNSPLTERRPSIDDAPARVSPARFRRLAESGLLGLLTTEMGGTHVDLLVLAEEHGRAGSPVPVAELAAAARLLEKIGHPALDEAAEGTSLVLPALSSPEDSALHASIEGTSLRIHGTTAPVTGLLDAHRLLLTVSTVDGTDIAVVLDVAAVTVRVLDTLDVTRSWAVAEVDLTLEANDWTLLPSGTVSFVHDQLATFRAADALGAAEALLDLTVEYAGQRTQFGQPIGSFQSVKHHCANMALSIEASRAALWAAAVALDGGNPDIRTRAVAAAAAFTGEGTSSAAQIALQVHGGIGFTWEHDLHLLIRRIKVDELLDGSVSYHRRRLVNA